MQDQAILGCDASALEPVETFSQEAVAERSTPEYSVKTGWIDTAGKTRTWVLCEPSGGHLAEIIIKRDATKLADLLNRATSGGRDLSR
jgi:hypothetical protein